MARPFDLLDRNFEPHRPRIELLVLPAVESKDISSPAWLRRC